MTPVARPMSTLQVTLVKEKLKVNHLLLIRREILGRIGRRFSSEDVKKGKEVDADGRGRIREDASENRNACIWQMIEGK